MRSGGGQMANTHSFLYRPGRKVVVEDPYY